MHIILLKQACSSTGSSNILIRDIRSNHEICEFHYNLFYMLLSLVTKTINSQGVRKFQLNWFNHWGLKRVIVTRANTRNCFSLKLSSPDEGNPFAKFNFNWSIVNFSWIGSSALEEHGSENFLICMHFLYQIFTIVQFSLTKISILP